MFSPNGIQAILFDLDGTLRQYQPDGGEVFVTQSRALGLSITENDRLRGIRWEHHYWANSINLRADLEKYKIEDNNFWQNYSRRHLVALGISPKQAEEFAPILSQYMSDHYKPVGLLAADALGVLGQLKEAGFRLGVVSNREHPFEQEMDQLDLGLEARRVPLPARLPTHLAGLAKAAAGTTVGVRVTDTRSGRRLVVLPSLTRIEPGALAELAVADCRFVDGTFWSADELRELRPGAPDAFAMGHVPISGPGGSLDALANLRGRTFYFHMNGTNPILDRATPEAASVRSAGIEIPADGLEFEV